MQHPLHNALLNGHIDLAKHTVKKYGVKVKGTAKVDSLALFCNVDILVGLILVTLFATADL